MAKISRVVSSDIGTPVANPKISIPIRVKLLGVVVLALVPISVLWIAASLFGFDVPLVVGACALLLGLGLGYFAGDVYFVEPVKGLLAWLSSGHEAGEGQAPVLPSLHPDEIGSLGARVLQMSERNKGAVGERSIFLTIAAHQLRTPITDLTWSIEEILDPSTTEESRRTLLEALNRSLKRTRLVINHILASANIEEGRFGYVMEMTDIVPAIEKMLAEFKPLSDDRKITLAFEHGVVPAVYADGERISLALFDLVSNAIDYTPEGGRVTIALRPNGDHIEVSVADTGIGIPEKELPFLFTKFHRGDTARHLRPNGSGLGLYLVKNIVDNHGSEIKIESDESVGGSKFSFFLPTKPPK